MKTYHEAATEIANMLGEEAYHKIMGGSMNSPWYGSPIDACADCLAIAYDLDKEDVKIELTARAQAAYDAHWPQKEEA